MECALLLVTAMEGKRLAVHWPFYTKAEHPLNSSITTQIPPKAMSIMNSMEGRKAPVLSAHSICSAHPCPCPARQKNGQWKGTRMLASNEEAFFSLSSFEQNIHELLLHTHTNSLIRHLPVPAVCLRRKCMVAFGPTRPTKDISTTTKRTSFSPFAFSSKSRGGEHGVWWCKIVVLSRYATASHIRS